MLFEKEILKWLQKIKNQKNPIFVLETGERIMPKKLILDIYKAVKFFEENVKTFEVIATCGSAASYDEIVCLLTCSILFQKYYSYYVQPYRTWDDVLEPFSEFEYIIVPNNMSIEINNNKSKILKTDFYKNLELNENENVEKILEHLKKYDNIKTEHGCSSSGSHNHIPHWTFHSDKQIWTEADIYYCLTLTKFNKKYANILYGTYDVPMQLMVLIGMVRNQKETTLHLWNPRNPQFQKENFMEKYITENKINTLLVLGTEILKKNPKLKNLSIIDIRLLKNKENIKNAVKHKNIYLNVFASSDYLIQFVSRIDKKNINGIGIFNYLYNKYRITLDGYMEYFYNDKWNLTTDKFRETKKGLVFLDDFSNMREDSFKKRESEELKNNEK